MDVKRATTIIGIIFVIIGLSGLLGGFGITGENGFFMTDTMHDFVHLISGIIFLLVAYYAPRYGSISLMTFGVIYGLLAIMGFMNQDQRLVGMLVNDADDYLHIVLAVGTFLTGYIYRERTTMEELRYRYR